MTVSIPHEHMGDFQTDFVVIQKLETGGLIVLPCEMRPLFYKIE